MMHQVSRKVKASLHYLNGSHEIFYYESKGDKIVYVLE